jgi:hypothetical protein
MNKRNLTKNKNFIALKDFVLKLNFDVDFEDDESLDKNYITYLSYAFLRFSDEEQKTIIHHFKKLYKYIKDMDWRSLYDALDLILTYKNFGLSIGSSIAMIESMLIFDADIVEFRDSSELTELPLHLFDAKEFRKVLAQHYNAERIFKDAKDNDYRNDYFVYHLLVHFTQQQCTNKCIKIENVHKKDIISIFKKFYKHIISQQCDAIERAIELAADLAYQDDSFYQKLEHTNNLKPDFFNLICSKCQKNGDSFDIKDLNISDKILMDSIEYGMKNNFNDIILHKDHFSSFLFIKLFSNNFDISEKAKLLIVEIWLHKCNSHISASKIDELKKSIMNILTLLPKSDDPNTKQLKMNFKFLALLPIENFDGEKCARILNRPDIQQKITHADISVVPQLIAESCTNIFRGIENSKMSRSFVLGSNQTFSDYIGEFMISECHLPDCIDLIPYFYEDKYVRLLAKALENSEDESYDVERVLNLIKNIHKIKNIWNEVKLNDSFLQVFMIILKKYTIFENDQNLDVINIIYKNFIKTKDYQFFDTLKKTQIEKDILKFVGMFCCLIYCEDPHIKCSKCCPLTSKNISHKGDKHKCHIQCAKGPFRFTVALKNNRIDEDNILELFHYKTIKGEIKNDDLLFLTELIIQCSFNNKYDKFSFKGIFFGNNTHERKTIISLLMLDSDTRFSYMKILSNLNKKLIHSIEFDPDNGPFYSKSFLGYLTMVKNTYLPLDHRMRIIEAFGHSAYGEYFGILTTLYNENVAFDDYDEDEMIKLIFDALKEKNIFDINIKKIIHDYFFILLSINDIGEPIYIEINPILFKFLFEIEHENDKTKEYILKTLKKFNYYLMSHFNSTEYFNIRWDQTHDISLVEMFNRILKDIRLILSLNQPIDCRNLNNWKNAFSIDIKLKNLFEIFMRTDILPENLDALKDIMTQILLELKRMYGTDELVLE